MLRLFKEVEKYVDVISKKWLDTLKETENATKGMAKDKPGSGRLGLASVTKGQAVAGAAMFAGWFAYNATPNTMAAVTQRIAADSFAGLSGMSSRQAITQSNAAIGGGATSAMGGTLAAQALFYSGYSANSASSQTIMGQLAGMSAMSGMSNQQAAGAAGAMNGMNFLRMGVNIRDSKGNLKPMDQIINQVYNFMYGGRKITKEQAATVYNTSSKGYADISMIANGDPNLIALIQSGIVARASASSASAFSSAMKSKDPNQMLNLMGVDESSPIRSNFRASSAQAKILQSTEQGLVGGYNVAQRTNADLTSGFADLLNVLGPVTEAFMTLKGALQTFPNTGGVGGTISSLGSTAASIGKDYLAYKAVSKYAPKLLEKAGGSAALRTAGKSILSRIGGWLAADALPVAEDAIVAVGGPRNYGGFGTGGPAPSSTNGILPVPQGTPITQQYGHNGHPGTDFGVNLGTPIKSFKDGVVSIIGNEANGYGNWVQVTHNDGTATRYAHLQSISTTRGQKVTAGDVIAKSGSTGHSTGPHLHFEVLQNGKKVNSTQYVMGAGTATNATSQTTSANQSSSKAGHANYITNKGSSYAALVGDLSGLSSSDITSSIASLGSSSSSSAINMFGNTVAHNLGNGKALSFVKGKTSVTPGVILGTGSSQQWAKTLLTKLGKPLTKQNIAALTTWAAWEGGQWHNSAHYNPLNTTQPANGATNMNKEGVKSYLNWDQGYTATIQTLKNGRYGAILSALTKGDDTASVLKAVDHSPWGTHIPGYGGPSNGMNVGTVGRGGPASTVNLGSLSSSGSSSANINLSMSVTIQNASVPETERLVHVVANRLKAELSKSPYALSSIGSGL